MLLWVHAGVFVVWWFLDYGQAKVCMKTDVPERKLCIVA